MRSACALSPAVGCAPSTSGRRNCAAAAPTGSQQFNASRRRRSPAAAARAASSSEQTGLMQREAFNIDPLPSKRRESRPKTFPSAVLSAQEVR